MASKKRPLSSVSSAESSEKSKKKQRIEEPVEDKKEEPKKEKTPSELIDEFLTTNPIPPEDLAAVNDDPRTPNEVYGVVKRQEVHMVREFEDVQLFEFENIKCVGAPVVISFPSIGLVGVLSGRQMVKTLNLPLIGVLKLGTSLRAACVVSHEQPSYPARVYGNANLVVFICEMSFRVPDEVLENLVECIFDFAHRHRSPMIYVLEGIPKPHVVQLPTGEEIVVRLGQAPGGGGSDEDEEGEESETDKEEEMLIDDSFLTKLTVRQRIQEKASSSSNLSSNSSATTSGDPMSVMEDKAADEEQKQSKPATAKRRRSRNQSNETGGEEEDKQFRVSKLADKLFADKIHYVTTSLDLAKKLRGLGHVPVVDGIITGVAGGLLAEAPLKTKDVAAILAPTSMLFPDPDSAVSVVKLLDTIVPNIGLGKVAAELEKDVASLKKMMKGLMQKLQSNIQSGGGGLRRSGGVPQGMYQ